MQRFINNWAATLTAPAVSGDLTLSVEPLEAAKLVGLGSGDHYLLTLVEVVDDLETRWEIVKVSGVAGGVLSVEWQQEGTGPEAWPAGTEIIARATAGTLESLRCTCEEAPGSGGAAAWMTPDTFIDDIVNGAAGFAGSSVTFQKEGVGLLFYSEAKPPIEPAQFNGDGECRWPTGGIALGEGATLSGGQISLDATEGNWVAVDLLAEARPYRLHVVSGETAPTLFNLGADPASMALAAVHFAVNTNGALSAIDTILYVELYVAGIYIELVADIETYGHDRWMASYQSVEDGTVSDFDTGIQSVVGTRAAICAYIDVAAGTLKFQRSVGHLTAGSDLALSAIQPDPTSTAVGATLYAERTAAGTTTTTFSDGAVYAFVKAQN